MSNDQEKHSFTFMAELENMKDLQKLAKANERTVAAEIRIAIRQHLWSNRSEMPQE